MTVRRLVYVIGEPGAGKTTAVEAACAPYTPIDLEDPIPHRAWMDGRDLAFVTLGRHRPPFSGTDTLGMSIQPAATRWLTHEASPTVVLAEGDRLGNTKFFRAMVDAGRDLTIVHLTVPPEIAAARRAARGTEQNATWLAGRRTKVANLTATHQHVTIDGTRPVDEIAADLAMLLH